jgi:hypothetical protein
MTREEREKLRELCETISKPLDGCWEKSIAYVLARTKLADNSRLVKALLDAYDALEARVAKLEQVVNLCLDHACLGTFYDESGKIQNLTELAEQALAHGKEK